MKKIFYGVFLFFIVISLTGCFIIKKMAGADIDNEQFDKAREAKMLEIKALNLESLSKKLDKGSNALSFDLVFNFSEELLNKVLHQYDSTSGWFDPETKYFIKSMNLKVENGSALVSMGMIANSLKYNVDVDLVTDCLLTFEIINNELVLRLEPFNISPNVTAKGVLSSADEIIKNLIKINLADLEKNLPQMKFPVSFTNQVKIDKNVIDITEKVNLSITVPDSRINYRLKIKDIICLSKQVLLTMNVENVEVK